MALTQVRAREQSGWVPCPVSARLTAVCIFFFKSDCEVGRLGHKISFEGLERDGSAFTTLVEDPSYQHPCGNSQLSVTPVSEYSLLLCSLRGPMCPKHTSGVPYSLAVPGDLVNTFQ